MSILMYQGCGMSILMYQGCGMSVIIVSGMWHFRYYPIWDAASFNKSGSRYRTSTMEAHTKNGTYVIKQLPNTYSITTFFQFTHFLIAWPFKCGRTFYVCLVISWRWRLTWTALPCENVPLRNRPNPFEFLINSGPQRLVVPNMYEYLRLTSDSNSTGFESSIASRWPLWAAEFIEHFYTVIYCYSTVYCIVYNSVIYCCTAIYCFTVLHIRHRVLFCFKCFIMSV